MTSEISSPGETDLVVSEFNTWQAGSNNDIIFLLDVCELDIFRLCSLTLSPLN
jgi:hypothetical protein